MDDPEEQCYRCIRGFASWRGLPPGRRLARRAATTAEAASIKPIFLPMSQEHSGSSAPAPEEIALCAYLIWENEGRPRGREREHWFQAETQLMACRAHDGWTGTPERQALKPSDSN
jgi:hypothetical protein